PRDPSTAVLRLGVFVLGTCVALAMATRALWRDFPRWDAWLESLEGRFTDLRSWLRNALDMEQEERERGGSGPAPHTSGELADAVQERAARRLDGTPLGETVPPLAARNAFLGIAVATLSLVASAVLAPGPTLAAWRTLWSPASAARPVTLGVEPGDVTVVPGASLAVRARIEGSGLAPRILGDGP